jgi:hypothetical protein
MKDLKKRNDKLNILYLTRDKSGTEEQLKKHLSRAESELLLLK